jgi:hypothetical protein
MDILNPADLKSLIAQQGKWCVSFYMPTRWARTAAGSRTP